MAKKILVSLALISMTGILVFFFLYYQKAKYKVDSALDYIPADASLIIETSNLKEAHRKLSDISLIWNNLRETPFFSSLAGDLKVLDSLAEENHSLRDIFSRNQLFVSLIPMGDSLTEPLFLSSFTEIGFINDPEKLLENFGSKGEPDFISSWNIPIKNVHLGNTARSFFYAHNEGVWIGSFHRGLVLSSLETKMSNKGITQDSMFVKIAQTKSSRSDGTFYFSNVSLSTLLNKILNPPSKNGLESLRSDKMAAALDLEIKPNYLSFTGFTALPESKNHPLFAFQGQKPIQPEGIKLLPASVHSFIWMGFSDPASFREKGFEALSPAKIQSPLTSFYSWCRDSLNLNPEDLFESWLGNEICTGISGREERSSSRFVVLHANDPDLMKESLSIAERAARKLKKSLPDSLAHLNYTIQKSALGDVPGIFRGQAFSAGEIPWYFFTGEYLVYGPSPELLKQFITDMESGNRLLNTSGFKDFYKGHLSSTSNIFLFSAPSRSNDYILNFLNEEFGKVFSGFSEIIKKHDGVSLQLSLENALFYTHLFLRHNPSEKKESTTLWETKLDTLVLSRPWVMENHLNGGREILVQDANASLYLISGTGKILWKKDLESPIMGNPVQVDAYRNNKLQYLLLTPHYLHLIDRNGKYVEGFPKKLKSPAISPMAVYDYDNSRDYRILFGTADRKIVNLTVKGETASKWTQPVMESELHTPPFHFRSGGKDYLIAVDKSGKIYVMNRRGETELKVKEAFEKIHFRPVVEWGKDIREFSIFCADSSGEISRIRLGGNRETIKTNNTGTYSGFSFEDITGDGLNDFIFYRKNEVSVFERDGKQVFTFQPKTYITSRPEVYQLGAGKKYLGFTCRGSEEIYLLDAKGFPVGGFPFQGSTPFAISDLYKNGNPVLISVRKDGTLSIYSLRDQGRPILE
jgi:hypothetical protein